jgi:hypothetical protein
MSKKPTLIAYSVKDREGQKAVWTRISADCTLGTGSPSHRQPSEKLPHEVTVGVIVSFRRTGSKKRGAFAKPAWPSWRLPSLPGVRTELADLNLGRPRGRKRSVFENPATTNHATQHPIQVVGERHLTKSPCCRNEGDGPATNPTIPDRDVIEELSPVS